jgi:TonB family protein
MPTFFNRRFLVAIILGLVVMAFVYWILWSFTRVTDVMTVIPATTINFSRSSENNVMGEIQIADKVLSDAADLLPEVVPIHIDGVASSRIHVQPPRSYPVGGGLYIGPDPDSFPIVMVDPEYPVSPRIRGLEGWVQVDFNVNAVGEVTDAVVAASQPEGVFEEAALESIYHWRYAPKMEGSVAVERRAMKVIIRFNLDD